MQEERIWADFLLLWRKGIDYAVCEVVLTYFIFDALVVSGSISCVCICGFASCNELQKGEPEG